MGEHQSTIHLTSKSRLLILYSQDSVSGAHKTGKLCSDDSLKLVGKANFKLKTHQIPSIPVVLAQTWLNHDFLSILSWTNWLNVALPGAALANTRFLYTTPSTTTCHSSGYFVANPNLIYSWMVSPTFTYVLSRFEQIVLCTWPVATFPFSLLNWVYDYTCW